jgi:hypothetical protein
MASTRQKEKKILYSQEIERETAKRGKKKEEEVRGGGQKRF